VTRAEASGVGLAAEARAGSRRSLARLLTAVESRTVTAAEALRSLYPLAGQAHVVGVTGPPGGGKSTLVAALVGEARPAGRTVAVLAIDPSSPVTGGAILGDRIRMQEHAADGGVFIRSMAARGHLGGLAGTTAEAAAVLDACGFALILIETVGTGQSEVEVASIADTTVVVQAPDMGDEVQALKAGLLEVADVVVVNKADRPGAERAAAALRGVLGITVEADDTADGREASDGRGASDGGGAADRPRPKRPEILLCSGLTGQGVPELLAYLDRRAEALAGDEGQAQAVRLARAEAQVTGIMVDRAREALRATDRRAVSEATLRAVAAHELDPYTAADRLLATSDEVRGP
jgi:LAO/AO transport system kinase